MEIKYVLKHTICINSTLHVSRKEEGASFLNLTFKTSQIDPEREGTLKGAWEGQSGWLTEQYSMEARLCAWHKPGTW